MTKRELAQQVAENCDLSNAAGQQAVDALFASIAGALKNGDKVAISGFGSFEVKERAAREGRNPRTGETIAVPASKGVKFKAAAALKEAVR